MPVPGKTALASFVKGAQKNYGARAIGRGDANPAIRRVVPLGPIRLDHALGGGIHIGAVHSFYGEKSGGKTTTAAITVARFQKLCRNCYRDATDIVAVPPPPEVLKDDPHARWGATGKCTCFAENLFSPEPPDFKDDGGKKLAQNSGKYKAALEQWRIEMSENSYEEYVCAWFDLEQSFDEKYLSLYGADPRRIQLIRPESAEITIDVLHAGARTVEIDLIVLDSIAQMAPNKEIESSAEDWQQGLQARLVNKMSRMLMSDASMVANHARSFTQIWINQTREKIGVMFGDPTTKPGGKGQEFAAHIELKFKKGKIEKRSIEMGSKDETVDKVETETFTFECTKNKRASTKGVSGYYAVRRESTDAGGAGSFIEFDDIGRMAMHFLVKQDPKSKKYGLAGEEYDSQKALLGRLREDAALFAATKTVLLEMFISSNRPPE